MELLATLAANFRNDPALIGAIGIGFGSMLAVLGLASAAKRKDPALVRIASQGARAGAGTRALDAGILKPAEGAPEGFMKTFVPSDDARRSAVQRDLSLAGFDGTRAVTLFFLVRTLAGIALPLALGATLMAIRAGYLPAPPSVDSSVSKLSPVQLAQIVCVMIAIGFFAPVHWLRARVADRRRQISEAFPNALDLVQISVQAGLGFDAAMIRVGNELQRTAPILSQLFLNAQREVHAGRSRDRALMDMAAHSGLDEVTSFANVVLQSMQYGTSLSGTLSNYATEMRAAREVRAQEKANKLPVQMSAVMAGLMLPALLILTLGPVVIRYIETFRG